MATRKHRVKPFALEIKTGGVGGILARLYRTILHDLGITADRYDALMARYIQKAALDQSRSEKASARASLSKELLKESMTWRTWVKGINFLAVVKFELHVKLHHANGKTTSHNVVVALDEVDPEQPDKGE